MNLLIFMAAFGVQYAVGAVIDLFPTTPEGGYDPRGYRLAFAILLAAQLAGLAWFLAGWRKLQT